MTMPSCYAGIRIVVCFLLVCNDLHWFVRVEQMKKCVANTNVCHKWFNMRVYLASRNTCAKIHESGHLFETRPFARGHYGANSFISSCLTICLLTHVNMSVFAIIWCSIQHPTSNIKQSTLPLTK